ncbi:MAG: GrlR family regulatory protein [Rhodocyclaceae bacterium]|nr:GrlR family regulatory protein [Rhodocyclaceae bacterium]
MGVEAMYGVEFVSSMDIGGYGVLVLETGRVFGGDSSFTFIGDYEIESHILKANVKCTNDRNVLTSVFGNIKEFNLKLEGKVEEKEFLLNGYMAENPSMEISVKLTRRAELP